ncbi:MAG: PepSY domain-containing protein [Pseudomonas sp.]
MKMSNAALLTLALTATASLAQAASIAPDEIVRLHKTGAVMDFEQLKQAALAKHPGANLQESKLKNVYGRYVYKTEMRDATGIKWDVHLDAKTAEVLKDKQDT